ncbi:MAG: hypothetical protein ACQEXX_02005 [Bacillota bacterium]
MSQPIVSWMNATHKEEITAPFDFGVVDAGDPSRVFTFNIWNNKKTNSPDYKDVSTMEDCTITTRGTTDNPQGDEVEVVKNNWFHAQVDSLGETDLNAETSKIGKDFSKPIGTKESTTKDEKGVLYPTPIKPSAREILGVRNNGDPIDAAGNFVTVSLQAKVPLEARSGRQSFKLRVSYRYV